CARSRPVLSTGPSIPVTASEAHRHRRVDRVPVDTAHSGVSSGPPGLPVVTLTPDASYTPEFRARTVEALGEDGAWLATSLLRYGWRAQYDLARAVSSSVAWSEDDPSGGRDEEFQIVRDLQVQSHMYAIAEQLATLVDAIRASDAGDDFFGTYMASLSLPERVRAVTTISRDDIGRLLGMPDDAEALGSDLRARGFPAELPTGVVDLADLPTMDVDGLLIPRSAMDRAVLKEMWNSVDAMVDGIHRNLGELAMFVDRPTVATDHDIPPQSLREVDNSFRHGLRVLFHPAVPNERTFHPVNPGEGVGTYLVDLYLPRRNEKIRFATVACSPDRTDVHIETTRMLCLRIGQIIRGFLGSLVFQNSALLVSGALLTLGGRTDSGPVAAS
ncbi:MAG: hypothetical protein ACSLFB_07870, partial [Acidimicrobiales bacterium]